MYVLSKPPSYFSLSWITLVVISVLSCPVIALPHHGKHVFPYPLVPVILPAVFASISFFTCVTTFNPW
jgi:hypothetical protein